MRRAKTNVIFLIISIALVLLIFYPRVSEAFAPDNQLHIISNNVQRMEQAVFAPTTTTVEPGNNNETRTILKSGTIPRYVIHDPEAGSKMTLESRFGTKTAEVDSEADYTLLKATETPASEETSISSSEEEGSFVILDEDAGEVATFTVYNPGSRENVHEIDLPSGSIISTTDDPEGLYGNHGYTVKGISKTGTVIYDEDGKAHFYEE